MSTEETRYKGRSGPAQADEGESLSTVRPDDVIAILCSDIHLSHKPPIARSAEPNWYEAMKRQLDRIAKEAKQFRCPIVCAGDVFDKWNPPPELINFALAYLPEMYAVPGQHDLPNHLYSDIHRSAYYTMVMAGKIHDLPYANGIRVGTNLVLYGFPWGQTLTPCRVHPGEGQVALAVIHAYIWKEGSEFEGAAVENHYKNYFNILQRYNAAVFGDNHKGFSVRKASTNQILCNNGTFFRRRSDERDYDPKFAYLYRDGTIDRLSFPEIGEDKFIEADALAGLEELLPAGEVEEFINSLKDLGDSGLDFVGALTHFLQKHSVIDPIKRLVRMAIAEYKDQK